jgi:hypothetical protein
MMIDNLNVNDLISELSQNEQDLYNLLFEIKNFKQSEKKVLLFTTNKIKELSVRTQYNDKILLKELNNIKYHCIDKIQKYNYIMDKMIDIVDNIK